MHPTPDEPQQPTSTATETTALEPLLPAPQPQRLSLPQWISAGLKAAVCLPANIGGATPSPLQLFLLIALSAAVQVGMARLEVPGEASFQLLGWLYPLCTAGFTLFLVWSSLTRGHKPEAHSAPVPAWFGLWSVAGLPMGAVGVLFTALGARDQLPDWLTGGTGLTWLIYSLMWVWLMLVTWRVCAAVTPSRGTQAIIIIGILLIEAFASTQLESQPWLADYADQEQTSPLEQESMMLSQEVFEDQQALLAEKLAAVSPRQPDRINVFGLVYAPYAQSVFLRESAMVTGVLQDRFGAQGHVVQMVNHPSVTDRIPWATNQNLRASLRAVARQMDLEHDVLVVYLSSHGGSDFKLASQNPPLEVAELTPHMLRSMLDEAGIRNRVIAVSACFSGGWVDPLSGDNTLVMTAADATHTSYGCGSLSELTYFGRALFDEQLRQTFSFEDAFAIAVPIIRQREIEGHKEDGFSNPQIAVGEGIRAVLARLERELKSGL